MSLLVAIKRHPWVMATFLTGLILLPQDAPSQEEVASAIRRYKDREASSGYYEEYEVKPRRQLPLVGVPGVSRGIFPYSPSAAKIGTRSRLADSHAGIKFYERRRCDECHVKETKDIHTTRANLTCRQCHGIEPIAGLDFYYSPFNPIRRHAYVCSKCHEGASASFASYVVHEPPPGSSTTEETFPALYYAYWLMLILLALTMAFFVPHSIMVGIRELLGRKRKARHDDSDTD